MDAVEETLERIYRETFDRMRAQGHDHAHANKVANQAVRRTKAVMMLTLEGRDGNVYEVPVGTVCQYSAAHADRGVEAETVIDCGPVGIIPACDDCADFYERW